MPPKTSSKPAGPAENKESKKNANKRKEKTIEDKTFGLKNKKGAKQQKFIQQVQHQVKSSGLNKTQKQLEKEREDAKKEKEKKKLELDELNSILRPVQSNAKGVDPKSVVCAFFKQGTCGKGAKCKFSHDLTIEKKAAKRSAYCDMRDDGEKETNADWDETKLMEVVNQKHGTESKNATAIICKFFLDAVENDKYGWFWNCQNGDNCKYRHALPPGFVLRKDKKKLDKDKEVISIEDLVERQRAALGINTTKVTLVTFLAWKRKQLRLKKEQEQQDEKRKRKDFKSGKEGGLSGREMFTFDPSLLEGDDEEADGADMDMAAAAMRQDDDGEEAEDGGETIQYREINFDDLLSEYQQEEEPKTQPQPSTSNANNSNNIAIDEDLFADDDDLDDLEDDLDELSVS